MKSLFGGAAVWVILTVVCWATFGRAIDASYFMDDSAAVAGNRTLQTLVGSLKPPPESSVAGRPLVNFTFALNYRFGGHEPATYRSFNIFLHGISATLVFLILSRTFKLRGLRGGPMLAFAAALVWAVHPLQTEAVMYITQRTELMVGLFYLATLYAAMRYWETRGHFVPPAKRVWLVLATICCCAGMACKEVMVTAPVVVLLYERTFVKSSLRDILRGSWPLYVGLALGWVVLAALNIGGPRAATVGFGLEIPPATWWLTQTQVLWMYLSKVFWPHPLVIHYELPYLESLTAAWPWVAATAALVTATAVLLWRRHAAGFVGAWVLLILSPTLVVPIVTEVAAERRMYLPLAAVVAMVVVGAYLAWGKMARKVGASHAPIVGTCVCAVVVAIVLGIVSAERLTAYHDEITLWGDTVAKQPDNALAHLNLGRALHYAGRSQEGIGHLEHALRVRPDYPDAHNGLGVVLSDTGRFEEAMGHFRRAIELWPDFAGAYSNLGIALGKSGRLTEAMEQFQKAIELHSDYVDAYSNMAYTLVQAGRVPEAVVYYRKAAQQARQQGLETWARELDAAADKLGGGR